MKTITFKLHDLIKPDNDDFRASDSNNYKESGIYPVQLPSESEPYFYLVNKEYRSGHFIGLESQLCSIEKLNKAAIKEEFIKDGSELDLTPISSKTMISEAFALKLVGIASGNKTDFNL